MLNIKRGGRLTAAVLAAAALVAVTIGPALATMPPKSTTTYNSVPKALPGNVPSEGFEATQTSEFGDLVAPAAASSVPSSVDVVMSSWGCQSGRWTGSPAACKSSHGATFNAAVTLTLYWASTITAIPQPGGVILRSTQTFAIPFRPSADPAKCAATPNEWFSGPDKTCYNGLATKVTFKFSSTTVLPSLFFWTVSYNTTHSGYAPIGETAPCYSTSAGCGYDALNVGVESFAGQPSAGSDFDPDGAVLNSTNPGSYCDGGALGAGSLRVDTPCWTGFRPLAAIWATSAP